MMTIKTYKSNLQPPWKEREERKTPLQRSAIFEQRGTDLSEQIRKSVSPQRVLRQGQKKSGFTLIELMATTLASSILAITAGIMLFQAYNAWTLNHDAINLQRDGLNAMDLITRAIRNSSVKDVVRAQNNSLILKNIVMNNEGVPHRIRFYRTGHNLIYDPDMSKSGDNMMLVDNGAQAFIVTTNIPHAIRIRLRLQRDNEKFIMDSTITHRNS